MGTEKKYIATQKVFINYYANGVKPPTRGAIIEKSKIDRPSTTYYRKNIDWYFVRLQDGVRRLIPEDYIFDLKEHIDDHDKNWSRCPKDKKIQIDAWLSLQRTHAENVKYYHNIK